MSKSKRINFTPEQIVKVEELAKLAFKLESIADYFGIEESTFRKIRKRQPEVQLAYKKGLAQAIERVAKTYFDRCDAGDQALLIYFQKVVAGWEKKEQVGPKLNIAKTMSPGDILDAVLTKLRQGEITIQEAHQLSNLATLKANIINNQSDQNHLKIDSKEELLTKISVIQRILDNSILPS